MGLWQALLGRSTPRPPKLDALFAVPTAALTLETTLGLRATGTAALCLRAAGGPAYAQTQAEVLALLDGDPRVPPVGVEEDRFGFTWLVLRRPEASTGELCADLHVAHTLLEEQGFATGLLCSHVVFEGPDGIRTALVYLYKQGTFYAFAPRGEGVRDSVGEVQVAQVVAGDLPVEADRQRWLALWGAPGL